MALSLSGLKRTRWYEELVRFLLGGMVTAGAALIVKDVSPSFGGLFLAFPAILAATSTLVEKHEREPKKKKVLRGNIVAGMRQEQIAPALQWPALV